MRIERGDLDLGINAEDAEQVTLDAYDPSNPRVEITDDN